MPKISFFLFLKELRFAYLVGTSFLIFGLIYGAFEIFEYAIRVPLDSTTMGYLHFSRGAITTLALLGWIFWTLYEYRAKFQEVVRQHDAQFVRILDNTSEAVIVTDAANRITFWNKAASELLGWQREEVTGEVLGTIVSLPEAGKLVRKGSQEVEMYLNDKSGQTRFVAVTVTSLLDQNDKPETYTYVVRDLTERAIRQSQMERSERLASLGHMAAGVAHEIGNPLTAISSIIQLLQRRTEDEKQLSQLERVRENISRITKIVRDLVDFSRPASQEVINMNMNEPIKDAVGLLRHDARCRDVIFDLELDDALPHIHASPDQMYQVIVNLVLNAVDAADGMKKPIVRLKTWSDNNSVYVTITDNGPGIPSGLYKQIFEPFFTTKQVGKGTGLGLAVCHNIITGASGTIDVRSQPGETIFQIILPVSR